jgi:hypothetical protein
VYRVPEPGHRYVIGADVAEGLAKGDYSVAVVIDRDTWEECAELHGHWEPDVYADHLERLARAYNAQIAVERNNHGHAVLATFKLGGVGGIFCGADGRPGWLTNPKTKPLMIDLLAECLRDDLIKVRSAGAHDEMRLYQVFDNGTTGAPSGYHDDRVIAWAIALSVARQPVGWAGDASALASLRQLRSGVTLNCY